MKLFEPAYVYVIELAKHRFASTYLYILSCLESFIVPFPPPDVLLAPMSVAQPHKAMHFALWTTISSVLGGVIGYLIGWLLFSYVESFIAQWGYMEVLEYSMELFKEWGFWAVLIAGFSPIPYKIFTISAGLLSLAFLPFVIASFVGRGLRFYLVAYFLAKLGQSFEPVLMKYIERLGWAIVLLFVSLILYIKFFS